MLLAVGCEVPPQPQEAATSDIEGITLADLKAEEPVEKESESLLTFTVLTYALDAAMVEQLEPVIDTLTKRGLQFDDAQAFEANGFAIGFGPHEKGALIAQQLQSIGAVRITQNSMVIPPNTQEILYGTDFIGSRTVTYSTSASDTGEVTLRSGKLGWILSGQAGAADTVQVTLCPAYWEPGASKLRLMAGQEPYLFEFFNAGRVWFPMQAGQFCVLGPQRIAEQQDTLDRLLFEVPRRKQVRFLVIIFGGLRQIDGN
jgi:hypothetical protein